MSKKSKQNENESSAKGQSPQSMQALLDLELVNLLESKKAACRLFLRASDAACDPRLRRALRFQILTAMIHADNIESLLENRQDLPESCESEAMDGMRKEANEITSDKNEDEHKDIKIISILQRIKHIDMASCGTAAAHAKLLGDRRAASVLHQAVRDEQTSDQCLTNLCMQLVGEPEREHHAVDFISNLAHWIERKQTMPYYGNRNESREYEGDYGNRGGRSRRQGRYEDEGDFGYENRGYRSGQSQERDEYGQFTSSGRGQSRYQDEGDYRGGYSGSRQGGYGSYESEFGGGSQGGYGHGGYGQSGYGQGGYGGGYEGGGRGSRGGYRQGRGESGRYSQGGSNWGNSGRYEDDDRGWGGQSGYGRQFEGEEDYRGGSSQRQGNRGNFGGQEGRSRGGRHSSQMQERDEYGQFAGHSGRGGWEYDEDEGRDYSRRSWQSRGSHAGR